MSYRRESCKNFVRNVTPGVTLVVGGMQRQITGMRVRVYCVQPICICVLSHYDFTWDLLCQLNRCLEKTVDFYSSRSFVLRGIRHIYVRQCTHVQSAAGYSFL